MLLSALLPAALLLIPGILTENVYSTDPVDLLVMNSLENSPNRTYSTEAAYRGVLLGALKRLAMLNDGFKFTYTEDRDYGPYLESVNGLAANDKEHTYWELLVRTTEGKTIRPDVGIGCYIPKPNEQIILKYTKW